MKEIYKNSYSEGHPHVVKDWAKVLLTPFEKVDQDMLDELADAADDWKVCACGNLCAAIPRTDDGQPLDRRLRALGRRFDGDVSDMMFTYTYRKYNTKKHYEDNQRAAIATHKAIEERAAEILTEMGLL